MNYFRAQQTRKQVILQNFCALSSWESKHSQQYVHTKTRYVKYYVYNIVLCLEIFQNKLWEKKLYKHSLKELGFGCLFLDFL